MLMEKYAFYILKTKQTNAGRSIFSHWVKKTAYANSSDEAALQIRASLPIRKRDIHLIHPDKKDLYLENFNKQ